VVLIDKHDHTLFQPLLYQVATGALQEESIAEPIRSIVHGWKDVTFAVASATGLDLDKKELQTSVGPIPYDYLVLALGNVPNFFGNESIHNAAFSLTTLPMAAALRNQVMTVFEQAYVERDPARRQELLTFVVVGGGPIGVEFSGALAGVVDHMLEKDYPGMKKEEVKVILLEAGDTLLPPFTKHLREYTHKQLTELGVEVRLNALAASADEDNVIMKDGTQVPARTLLWATGSKAPVLTNTLNLPLAHGGRIEVGEDFSVKGHPEIFAIGDVASYVYDGAPLPGLAQPAVQGGEYVAEVITKVREQGKTIKPFRFLDKGIMAVIGRRAAVTGVPKVGHYHEMKTPADEKYRSLTGFIAWQAWLGVHMAYLHGFQNKAVAVIDWSWSFARQDSQERLATIVTKQQAQVAVGE
jgi:NADH dehydrogenase